MNINVENSKYAQEAIRLFKEGFNCAQAVFLAFEDKYNIERDVALRLSSSFGGGMGRLREVCGAVTGMFMVAGVLYGYDEFNNHEKKSAHYTRIQQLAREFEVRNGSIICRQLLDLDKKTDHPVPEKRTEQYYQKRPCVELVGIAAAIMEQYIKEEETAL